MKHNEMIIALSAISDDSRKPPDLGSLKVALYSHLQTGWNAQSSVPDALSEFRFPLVHWACVLGRTQALSWLLSKMKFKAFVVAERTGETGLHRALRLLHQVRSRDATPRSVDFICNKFSLILYTLTEQDPSGLFLKDKVQGNSAFHICALCISQQGSVNRELEYYENCMKILLVRVTSLQTMEKLPKDALQKAINTRNDRGETILHILARSNISVKTVKYLLSDYKEVVNKFPKNDEKKSPLDIARDRKADLVENELLDSAGFASEQLAQNHPDVYQLYTQEAVEVSSCAPIITNAADEGNITGKNSLDNADASGGYFLRISSLLSREGFYRGPSQGTNSCDDSSTQDELGHSPSVLDTMPVSENSTPTNTMDSAVNDNHSGPDDASQHGVLANASQQDSCVSVVVENSVLMNVEEDETDDDDDGGGGGDLSCDTIVVNCAASDGQLTLPCVSNSLSDSSQLSESVLPMAESEDIPESARASRTSQDEDTCSSHSDPPIARENGECSSLAKVIRQESDMASMLVARLQDKKEQNRVELRRAQRELTAKQERENQANRILVQLKAELENIRTQKKNLEQRRRELLEELKSTERNISQLQEESHRLQSSVDEQAGITESLRTERDKANVECATLKRKFTEYSEALSDICLPCFESNAKKERSDDG